MKILFPFLVFGLFANAAGQSEVIASVGEDVILPCSLTHPSDMSTLRVEWTHDEDEVHLYRKGGDDLAEQHENFKHRTSLFREEMSRGNISLKLTKVTELDAGEYSCNVKANFSGRFPACSVTLAVVRQSGGSRSGGHGEDAGISTAAVVGVSFSIVLGISVGLMLLMNYRKNRSRTSTKEVQDC